VLDDVVGCLACPVCGAGLARAGGALRCPRGHSFDIARQGYASLLPAGSKAAGDTAAMVAARAGFLAAGHYAALAGELAGLAEGLAGQLPGGCVADIGAGTGYYLAAVLDRLPGRAGLAVDASRYALRRAARAHPRIGAVAADAWARLPVADGAAALALNVFAPRGGAELARILRPGGALLVVAPDTAHLAELAGPLRLVSVDPRKDERLAANLGPYFGLAARHRYRTVLTLGHEDIAAAVAMGPSAWHADAATAASRVACLPDSLTVTVSVTMSVFRPATR
jgi:23S rRNA (guanine745-N1)-methyltransferase